MDNHIAESLRPSLSSLLAEQLHGCSPQFGKTVFMKLAYLLQEVYKVPLGYRFTLYTYGPYSTEVLADLDTARLRGWVSVDFSDEYGGFRITPGPKAGQTTKEREAFADYQGQISALINTFGRLRAKELELRTTITYVSHMMESSDESATSRVPGIVRQLKPHFSELEIEKAAEELKRNGVIKW